MESRTTTLDPEKVGGLAVRIAAKSKEVSTLRANYEEAERYWRHAETELSNLRREFTKAVDGHLSMSELNQKPSQSFPVGDNDVPT